MDYFRKNLLGGLSMRCDWPYFMGAMFIMALLVLRYLDPSFLALSSGVHVTPGSTHEHQRSLQEIESSCYPEQSQDLIPERCEDDCTEQDEASQLYADRSNFKRSILICTKKDSSVAETISGELLQGLVIEVITTDISF